MLLLWELEPPSALIVAASRQFLSCMWPLLRLMWAEGVTVPPACLVGAATPSSILRQRSAGIVCRGTKLQKKLRGKTTADPSIGQVVGEIMDEMRVRARQRAP